MTQAKEKKVIVLEMEMGIGSRSKAWRALTKTAAEKHEVVYDRAKSKFESMYIRVSETFIEHFARVHVVLSLTRHKVNTPTHEIKHVEYSAA